MSSSEMIVMRYLLMRVDELLSIISAMQKKPVAEEICPEIKGDSVRTHFINEATIVESLCMNCEQNGKTVLLLTKIPFFREVMLSSFACDECGFRNNEVQFVGKLPDFGVEILFRALTVNDLGREIVKSSHAVVTFKELDLEIPANGKSEISTIEGLLRRVHDEL